jgi:hypothetical protein
MSISESGHIPSSFVHSQLLEIRRRHRCGRSKRDRSRDPELGGECGLAVIKRDAEDDVVDALGSAKCISRLWSCEKESQQLSWQNVS